MPKISIFDDIALYLTRNTANKTRLYFRKRQLRPGNYVYVRVQGEEYGWMGKVKPVKDQKRFVLVDLVYTENLPLLSGMAVSAAEKMVIEGEEELTITVTEGGDPIVEDEEVEIPVIPIEPEPETP